jgi:hypothetical protein
MALHESVGRARVLAEDFVPSDSQQVLGFLVAQTAIGARSFAYPTGIIVAPAIGKQRGRRGAVGDCVVRRICRSLNLSVIESVGH